MGEEPIPLAGPDITKAEVQAVQAVLATDRLSIGPQTEAFEAALAERAGRAHGVAVNSGTSGLHLCVRGLGIGEGDEVITTPFSFVATTNSILFERATPVFVDIDPDSYNMDPGAIEQAITPRTKALLPVEVFGNTAHFDEYERIARKHGLLLIEDSCEALGGVLGDRPAGSFGECGLFAFYPNKQITTGEGGMIVTDDDRLAALCRSMRNQGRDETPGAKAPGQDARSSGWLSHVRLGYNYRMSEITAALGVVQAGRLDEILEKRRRAADLYDRALGDVEQVHLPPMAERERASWFVYVIRLADEFSQDQRDAVMARLRSSGVGCAPYFVPIHIQPHVAETLGTAEGDFPVTERIAARTIALPFFSALTARQVARVKGALLEALAQQTD